LTIDCYYNSEGTAPARTQRALSMRFHGNGENGFGKCED
jgi:hypothetical protein